MRFEGTFLNEKGEKVHWWFDAPNQEDLKKHLNEKGWKPLHVTVEEPVSDPDKLRWIQNVRRLRWLASIPFLGFILFIGLIIAFDIPSSSLFFLWIFPIMISVIILPGPLCDRICPNCNKRYFGDWWDRICTLTPHINCFYAQSCFYCDFGLNGKLKKPIADWGGQSYEELVHQSHEASINRKVNAKPPGAFASKKDALLIGLIVMGLILSVGGGKVFYDQRGIELHGVSTKATIIGKSQQISSSRGDGDELIVQFRDEQGNEQRQTVYESGLYWYSDGLKPVFESELDLLPTRKGQVINIIYDRTKPNNLVIGEKIGDKISSKGYSSTPILTDVILTGLGLIAICVFLMIRNSSK